jgi:adenosylmethionine-8-amino-7-oxononanoate aminotransferase
VIFQQGGGEAVDLACKLAAQYHSEAGHPRTQITSRQLSYHGVSLLPFALSGHYPRYEIIYLYQSDAYWDYVNQVKHSYYATDKARVPTFNSSSAAFIVEPVTGPTLGCWLEKRDYMKELRRLCDSTDVLLIFDEILCGTGRCGYMSTAKYYDVWPDIILLGKGLAAGYQPVSAIVVSKKVVDRIAAGSGYAMFGTAFSAHSVGCAAVAATLQFMRDQNLYDKVQSNTSFIESLLLEHFTPVDNVRAVRGLGHLWGLEFQDPKTGKSFNPTLQFHLRARNAVMEEGAVVYSKGQTVDGVGDFMTIAPAYTMSQDELRLGVGRIATGITKAYQSL